MADDKVATGGALEGLRVVEMGVLLAGPFCGQILADFGAEVIKVEMPGSGDPMREWGREKPHGKSLWWPVVARNKKSVTLNLRTEEGQALAKQLIAEADIVVENFRPGTMEKWNLGYEELAAINPGLIMIRVTGFGQDGPYSTQPGYGAIGEAMGGLRYVVGDPDKQPARTGISIGDTLAATFGAIGGLVALEARHRTGKGQIVDSAIYEAVLNIMESLVPEYAIAGYTRERTGAILPNVAPSNVYPTKDGMLLIAANQDTVFKRLADAMGQPELAEDERYASHSARGEYQGQLDDLIADWTSTQTTADLRELMLEHAVPHGPIYKAADMLDDPHFKARQAIVNVPHREFGEIPMQNVAPKLSMTPGAIVRPAPELGEHNDEVFQQILGLSADEQAELAEAGHL